MLILNEKASVVCAHELGAVVNKSSQNWVYISGSLILIEPDPVGRNVVGCPAAAPGIVPCLHTVTQQEGISNLVWIDGKRACLDSTTGFTDGSPNGTIIYKVRKPGQGFVSSVS